MDWTSIAIPVVAEGLNTVIMPVVGAVILYVAATVGGVVKKRLNVDVEIGLNTLLHSAVQRIVAAMIARYSGSLPASAINDMVDQLRATNPDTAGAIPAGQLFALISDEIARQRK